MRPGKLITDMTPEDTFYFKGFQRIVNVERAKMGCMATVTVENVTTTEQTVYHWNINDPILTVEDYSPQYAPGHTYTW